MALGRSVEGVEGTSDEGTRAPQTRREQGPAEARRRGPRDRHLAQPGPGAAPGLRARLHAADAALRLARAFDAEPDPGALQAVRGLGNRAAAAHARPAPAGVMRIDPADAPGEHEADRIAAEVVDAGAAPVRAPRPIVARAAPAAVARAAEPTHGPEGGPVDAAIERRILAAAGTGARLDDAVRRPLERGFGVDLAGLRIHTGAEADGLSRSLRARAFTVGPDIFFRSGAFQPHCAGGRRLLAHEVTHALQQGALAGPLAVQRSLTIQRDYEHLDALGRARVDSQAARDYEDKAEEFEYALGIKLSTSEYADEVADDLLGKVRTVVDAWADATKQDRLKTYEQEFGFEEGDKYYGAFVMTGEAIKKVFDHLDNVKYQPLRKRLKVVYNAVRNNNLAKWLKVAADNLAEADRVALVGGDAAHVEVRRKARPARTAGGALDLTDAATEQVAPEFAASSGLKAVLDASPQLRADVTQASAREKVDLGATKVHVAAPDMWSNLARGSGDEVAQLDRFNRDRLVGKNAGVDLDDQETLTRGDVPDLTAHEIQLLQQRRGKGGAEVGKYRKWRFKGQREKTLLWEQGREAYTVLLNSPLEKAASEICARLEAGVSGSAAMMFTAAKNLGLREIETLRKLRLAMLGWMLPNHDHSFYEIMRAAEVHQVPFKIDPDHPGAQYQAAENFEPESVDELQSLLPEHQYPAYFLSVAYKNALAGGVEAEAQQDAHKPGGPDHTLAKYRQQIEDLGLDPAVAQALDERSCVELLTLSAQVAGSELAEEVGDEAARNKLHARNVFTLAHLREGSSYRYLGHKHPLSVELWLGKLLTKHNKPRLIDHELLDTAAANLLALDTAAARRTSLVDAGVPAPMLDPLGEHVINDLAQLHAVLVGMPFDRHKRIDEDPNAAAYQKLQRTDVWSRLSRLNPLPGFMATYRLLRVLYGDTLTHALFDQAERTPRVRAALALGVPDAIAAALPEQSLAELERLIARIGALAGQPDALVQIRGLGAEFAPFKAYLEAYFGANRFDMVVAAVAEKKRIDISAEPRLLALAQLSSVLSSGALPTLSAAAAGYRGNMVKAAKRTASENLASEGRDAAEVGYPNLTDVEATAIQEYTGSAGDGEWQRAISQAFVPEPAVPTTNADYLAINWNAKLPAMAPKIQAAVAGLRKLPVYPAPVYSGQRNDLKDRPEDAMRIFAVGTLHPQQNFLSTSKGIDTSYITRNGPGVAWVIEHIRTGRDISYLSRHFEEKEVLFPPGARLLVTRVEDRTDPGRFPGGHGKVWVFMDEV